MAFGENGLWLARSRPPRKGHYRSPQVVKQAYREGWSFSTFGRDAARDTNVLPTREASLTIGGTSTVRERGGS